MTVCPRIRAPLHEATDPFLHPALAGLLLLARAARFSVLSLAWELQRARRYHGTGDDQLANKYLGRAKSMALEPPADATVKSLWLGGVEADITQPDIRDKFYSFGELSNIKIVPAQRCAFVEVCVRMPLLSLPCPRPS